MLKKSAQVRESEIYRNQNTLGSATINLCHPHITLMTERELRDTCLKKIAERGGGMSWTNESTIQDFSFSLK